MSEPTEAGLSFPLRSGETCALHPEMLIVGQRQVPLREIASAGLVADLSAPVAPGLPPTPGVALRLGDGASVAFTPVEPLDCWRLLRALAATRPEAVGPLPPPPGAAGPTMGYGPGFGSGYAPGFAPGYGPGYGAGYAPGYPPPMGAAGPSESDRILAGLCHLSVFFAPVILPLIIWLAMRRSQPYASQQAKQAFWFHLFFAAIAFLAGVGLQFFFFMTEFTAVGAGPTPDPIGIDIGFLPGLFVFYGLLIILGLINAIFSVIGAVQAFHGKPFHYPLLGWLAR